MAGKTPTPAPIDRPLSRAYLRGFTGWSSAYPPGISDPTSLQVMENVMVNRDGSCKIRPGLRYISYATAPADLVAGTRYALDIVGTHEPFFLNDGSKAYLFAVRELDGTVSFRCLADLGLGMVVQSLTAVGVDFVMKDACRFTSGTTYVKYLQIDNKVFALSNNGEAMKMFTVGATKTAKTLKSVVRPDWTVADKLTVVHPDAAWVNSASATTLRANALNNPSFEYNVNGWLPDTNTALDRVATPVQTGAWSGRVTSVPERTNYVKGAAHDTNGWGMGGWTGGTNASGIGPAANGGVGVLAAAHTGTGRFYADSSKFDVPAGIDLRVAWNLTDISNAPTNGNGVLVRFYDTTGARIGADRIYTFGNNLNRKTTVVIPSPAGTVQMSLHMYADRSAAVLSLLEFKDVMVYKDGQSGTFFDGASGANYFWQGTSGNSQSVYHPPKDVKIVTIVTTIPGDWNASAYFRSSSTARACSIDLLSDAVVDTGSTTNDASGSWTRVNNTITSPVGAVSTLVTLKVAAVPHGEYHYIDAALMENVTSVGTYFDGDTADTGTKTYSWTTNYPGGVGGEGPAVEQTFSVGGSLPPAETKTANTLISNDKSLNIYNFGFFYTFNTEIGESAASQVTVVRAQRAWQAWRWNKPNAAGEPDDTLPTSDGDLCADQLVAYMPQAVYDNAVAQGALGWSLYMFTWSDQDPVPVTAVRVGSRDLDPAKTYTPNAWLRGTPMMADAGDQSAPLPTKSTRRNYTDPSRGGQGIVAADRMVLVYDPVNPAVIRWTSNAQGAYTDFTAGRGGGYKTLTSGNLFVPAAVKLWQNPQSADTITILCMGVDGMSTGYYMAPAQVASQSEAVNIMSFEETTATPGTTSPYGCEVFNNALYHPLDEMLMKSTATNYNINHSSLSDQIADAWQGLANKHWIVSSVHDNRLYYLVYNPSGAPLEPECRGNEVWVYDGQAKAGTWSRWLVQGVSLRKMQQGGAPGMGLVRPDGMYVFDESYSTDDYVALDGTVTQRNIPWYFMTNTQGANRAHDAWAYLQQCNVMLGNFTGELTYGVTGLNVHGKRVDKAKVVQDHNPPGASSFDLEDFLLVRENLKEWFFYASSTEEDGVTQFSSGQFDLVQYRYTPTTVNTGYENGSIETFEYGRDLVQAASNTTNGVPVPMIDTARP